jgi:xanthine dehydrogenase YagS FAD-binding subunit
MKPFAYSRVAEPADALKRAGNGDVRFLAGGTNLVDFMKLEVEKPERIVDINALQFATIEPTEKGVRIGAMVRNTELAYHPLIVERYPVLSQALLSGATPQIRNMATVGGNLLQRTRCTYFRDLAWACNKRAPGSGCSAIEGYNKSHASLGTSDQCIATHPSDMCVAMMALDAVVVVEGANGSRQIPINDFYVAYGEDPAKENTLEKGELITHVDIPDNAIFRRSHYLKVRDRTSFEFALASAAVAVEIRDGQIAQSRVALGGVASKPWRAFKVEDKLQGALANRESFVAAAEAELQAARPQKHNAFKVELAKRTIVRALETVSSPA